MKHTILPLFIAAALMTACGGKNKPSEEAKPQDSLQEPLMESVSMVKEFRTFTVSDCLCFVVNEPDPFEPEYTTTGVKDEFSIAWPETGMMTDRAMKELMSHYFGPDASIDIKRAVNNWRQKTIAEYGNPVKKIDEDRSFSYSEMNSTCRQDSNLATFIINYGNYNIGAAHGMYALQYVTVDVESGDIIHLQDLIDTTRLGYAVARAIQDLDVNSDTRDCLFDEYQNVNVMPVNPNFFIDSTRSSINVVYDLYEITPYCCGIQTVSLPVRWLTRYITLTPYAKRLFGLAN